MAKKTKSTMVLFYTSVLPKLSKKVTVKDRNKVFKALSPKQKRQEIAWDCLNLILVGKIAASEGYYWNRNLKDETDDLPGPELQQKLLTIESCTVCARGGMMLSQIRLGNHINTLDYSSHQVAQGFEGIIKGFSYDKFREMEAEYEHSSHQGPYDNNTSKKLANICCNIIINGNFKRGDKTDYLTKFNIKL